MEKTDPSPVKIRSTVDVAYLITAEGRSECEVCANVGTDDEEDWRGVVMSIQQSNVLTDIRR